MKKLIKLFSLFTLAGLLFIGCQSAEDMTSPVGDLARGPGFSWGTPPSAVNASAGITQIDLVAGQNQVVGYLEVEVSGTNLLITYNTTGGWYITETHLQVVAHPSQFFVNPAGNPIIGSFPYGDDNLNTNEISYTVPIPEDLTEGMVYIGAHAVVCTEGSGSGTTAVLCPPLLVNNATLLTFSSSNPNYYKTLYFDVPIIDTNTVFDGWCVDATRNIGLSNVPLNMNLLCSYNLGDLACVIEKPEFLDQVNWLINNRGSFSKFQIQGAIWKLLSDSDAWMAAEPAYASSDYMAAYTAAISNGVGFIPACGEKVLIIMYDQANPGPDVCSRIRHQVLAFEALVPCEQEQVCETAWAFNYPADLTSKLFPGHVWFRYFGYKAEEAPL